MHHVRIFESVRGSPSAQHSHENLFITVIRPLLVELIGTFLLVLLCLWSSCSMGVTLVQGALCSGCTLMCLLACFGHISGTHLNPCVTLGIFIAGEVRSSLAVLYVLMQVLGGLGAAGLSRLLISKTVYRACDGGATLLNGTSIHHVWQGLVMEMLISYMLVTVILLVALDTKSKTGLAPLLIGLTLTGNILAAGSHTGGSMNPARSLGPAVVANRWRDHWIYWLGPLVGGAVAGVIYRLVWAHEDRRWPRTKARTKVTKINDVAAATATATSASSVNDDVNE